MNKEIKVLQITLFALLLAPVLPLSCATHSKEKTNTAVDDGSGSEGNGGFSVSEDATSNASDSGDEQNSELQCIPRGADDDVDEDGFTPAQGDCDDCDPNRNPNAIEVVNAEGSGALDEDCDNAVDEIDEFCDAQIPIDESDGMVAVRAIDLCKTSQGVSDWGVVSARWTLPDGSPPNAGSANFDLGHGVFDSFGAVVRPRAGSQLLALSTGTARRPSDPGFHSPMGFDKGYAASHPQGYPKEAPSCPGVTTGQPFDAIALEVKIRVPSNAYGFSFDFNFFTWEWPEFVCSEFNDYFIALLEPKPSGQNDGNISYDRNGNPVGVNSAFVAHCGCEAGPPCQAPPDNGASTGTSKLFDCPGGDYALVNTGFGRDEMGVSHAATGWLKSQAPVTPGSEITVRFVVYDSGDGSLDTTALIDNFRWLAHPGVEVETEPIR